MTTPSDPWQHIAAFADGELDGEQSCELLRAALDDPEQARRVLHQQQLRKALAGCMDCKVTMRCPDELKDLIASLPVDETSTPNLSLTPTPADAPSPAPVQQAARPVWFRHPNLPWGIAAAFAAAFIGALEFNGGLTSNNGTNDTRLVDGTDLPSHAQPPVNGSAVPTLAAFAQQRLEHVLVRHVRCGMGYSAPAGRDAFPTEPQALARTVADKLGTPGLPLQLNLADAGLHLRLAGQCSSPGAGSIHVLYDATNDQNQPAGRVSLWIKTYHPGTDPLCTPGQVETLAGPDQPHPVLLWRDDQRLYLLVGDAMSDVQKAKQQLTANAI